MNALTQHERAVLNKAAAIIHKHTAYRSSWMFSFAHYEGCDPSFDATYFDSAREQHPLIEGATLADKIQAALEAESRVDGSREAMRERRIAALRRELAELAGDAA